MGSIILALVYTYPRTSLLRLFLLAPQVIGVVMDMFTDVDIFKDLLEAGFRRKVAIYIIVDETNVKYFLQMCERAQMHAGHLKVREARQTACDSHIPRAAGAKRWRGRSGPGLSGYSSLPSDPFCPHLYLGRACVCSLHPSCY